MLNYQFRAVYFDPDTDDTVSFPLSSIPPEYGEPDTIGVYLNLYDGSQRHVLDLLHRPDTGFRAVYPSGTSVTLDYP